MSVDEYTREFEKLLIKCDIQEPEEQTIVRYLGGLEPKYANVVELQQFTTFNEVCVLAHKVEQQKKRNPFRKEPHKKSAKNRTIRQGSSKPVQAHGRACARASARASQTATYNPVSKHFSTSKGQSTPNPTYPRTL